MSTEPMRQETDKKTMEFVRKYAITPHLMDVGFFKEPSFEKYVEAARSANKAGAPIKYFTPFVVDSMESLKVGYDAFMEDFKEKRTPETPPDKTKLASGGMTDIRQQTQNVANCSFEDI